MDVARAASRLSQLRPQVGAAVIKGGRVLGIGFNRPGSSKYSKWTRHAEVVALLNARGRTRGATLYVWRGHGLTGEAMLAKPCAGCQVAIRLAGIKKVVYSEGRQYGV